MLAARHVDGAILLIRIIVGVVFIAHGYQKVFSMGTGSISSGFSQMGIPGAPVMGPFISFLELLGGVALVFGVLTRLAAAGLMFDMAGAIWFVHGKNGFFLPAGSEFALTLAVICLAVILAGAGRWSIDAMLAHRRANRV